jgi:hypothetical protein
MSPGVSRRRDLAPEEVAIIDTAMSNNIAPGRPAPPTAEVNVDLDPKDEFVRPLSLTR